MISSPPPDRRPRPVRRAAVGALVTGLWLLAAGPMAGPAAAQIGPGGLRPDTEDTSNGDEPNEAEPTPADETDAPTPTSVQGGALAPTGLDPDDVTDLSADDESGTSALALAGVGLIGAVVGLGIGFTLAGRRSGNPAAPAAAPPAVATGTPGPGSVVPRPDPEVLASRDRALDHRGLLVQTVIEVGDQVSSEAVRAQLAEALQRVGVVPHVVEPGSPFDPQRHRGVQAVRAASPATNGTVATCDRPGWVDGDRTLRLPEVVVYRWEDPS